MSRLEKLLKRFLSRPADFTYSELDRMLKSLGYEAISTGHTAGSRVAFYRPITGHIVRLHRPHPQPILKRYQIDQLIEELKREGLLP